MRQKIGEAGENPALSRSCIAESGGRRSFAGRPPDDDAEPGRRSAEYVRQACGRRAPRKAEAFCRRALSQFFIVFRETEKTGGGIMKKITGAAALCAAWLCGGAALAAQPETDPMGGPVYGLDAVIVTASREPELARDADADVSVITADDIEKNHYANVAEAVKQVPGVIVGSRITSSSTARTRWSFSWTACASIRTAARSLPLILARWGAWIILNASKC